MASNASFRATQSTTLPGDGPSRRRFSADVRLPHHDQPIRLVVRERSKQHGVDEREERGRGRDAEAEQERDADRDARRAHERPQCLCDIMPCAGEDEIPDQREPRRRQGEGPTGVSRFEQALAVVADGMPLLAVAPTKHPEEPGVAPGAPPQEPIAGHARWGFRNARLERALLDNRLEAPDVGIEHALAERCQRKVAAPFVVFVGGGSLAPTPRSSHVSRVREATRTTLPARAAPGRRCAPGPPA